jgi:hypothetical protein
VTRRQRAALTALAVAVVLAGLAVVLFDDGDERADVSADASSTSTTADTTTASTVVPATTTTSAPTPTTTAAVATTGAARASGPSTSSSTSEAASTRQAPPTTAPAPPFESSIEPVTAAQLGASWREGCPIGPDELRALEVFHWGYDGVVRRGRVIVHADHAERIVAVLRDVYAARFPIERMEPIDRFGGDDQASMRANNTSGFNCRYVSGTTSWSEHSYGRAIDVNPLVNPYVKGSSVDPPEGAPYADRSRDDPGMIRDGDAVVEAFARQGWRWGGSWTNGQDYQHFSASGR